MSVTAWRIYKPRYAQAAFSGDGARLFGGRFNSKGGAAVYVASSVSLAMVEMLVHLESSELVERYELCQVTFGRDMIERLDRKQLPRNWRESPVPPAVQALGDAWLASGKSAVLEVPSAVVEGEPNYLLNPRHADFQKIRVGPARPFQFDPRLK